MTNEHADRDASEPPTSKGSPACPAGEPSCDLCSNISDAIYGDAEAVDQHEQEVVLDAVMVAVQLALDAHYEAGWCGWDRPSKCSHQVGARS